MPLEAQERNRSEKVLKRIPIPPHEWATSLEMTDSDVELLIGKILESGPKFAVQIATLYGVFLIVLIHGKFYARFLLRSL